MKTQKIRKRELLCVILLLFSGTLLYGQKEGCNWIFGNQAGITFMPNGSPSDYSGRPLDQVEGCATLSDPSGNLLLFTNGDTVWDYNNSIVVGGLYGNQSSTQSSIIVPKPDSPSVFYVFTIYEDFTFFGSDIYGLRYSIIRGSNNNTSFSCANGEKNILICLGVSEKLTAVKKEGSEGFWIVTHEQGNSIFRIYSFDKNGVVFHNTHSTGVPHLKPNGYLKFSPSGTKLACATYTTGYVEVYDFDPVNGIIGTRNATQYMGPSTYGRSYGVEFSPDESLLYFTCYNSIYIWQIDLKYVSGNVFDSVRVCDTSKLATGLATENQLGALQLGPDQKIYVARNAYKLGVINDPNNKYNPDFQDNDAPAMANLSQYGLPNFSTHYVSNDYLRDTFCDHTIYNNVLLCIGESTTLSASDALSYDWQPKETIEPGTDNTANPVVFPLTTTIYTVTGVKMKPNMIYNEGFENGYTGFDSEYDSCYQPTSGDFYLTDDPQSLSSNFLSCSAHSGTYMMFVKGEATVSGKEVWSNEFLVNTDPGDSFLFSFWATSIHYNSPAVLKVYVEETNSAKQLIGTLNLSSTTCAWTQFEEKIFATKVNQTLRISIVDDNLSGSGNEFALDDLWFSGFCYYQDYVKVNVSYPVDISTDVPCLSDSVVLTATYGFVSYTWDDGSTNRIRTVYQPGLYRVDVVEASGCSTYEEIIVKYCYDCEITLNSMTQKCTDDTITLYANGGLWYNWTPTQYIVPGTESTSTPRVFNPVPTQYTVEVFKIKENLLSNGSFEMGNVGFYSEYLYKKPTIAGNYFITDTAYKANNAFSNCTALQGDSMMVVNGKTSSIDTFVWFDTVFIQTFPGDTFYFSFWATNVYPAYPATLDVYIEEENSPVRLLGKLRLSSDTTCIWLQFKDTLQTRSVSDWFRISIVDSNRMLTGNEFALDSIYFSGLCRTVASIFVDTTYCEPCEIFVNNDVVKCIQDPYVLLSAEGALTYNWTPTQYIVVGTQNTANPAVFPPVSTTYTVTGVKGTGNLIANGGFEQGNVGFYSDYSYNSYPTSGKYYITDNPNSVYYGFASCSALEGDSMMLVNGEEFTSGKEIWFDTIDVQANPGDTFYFSFWATSVDYYSPAELRVYVEGDNTPRQLIGSLDLTWNVCNWYRFEEVFEVFHSNQYLRISLEDDNMNGSGNDFALDSFWLSGFCRYEDAVFVAVEDCSCKRDLFEKGVSHDTINFLEEGQSIKYTNDCGFIGAVNTYEQTTGIPQMELLKLDDAGAVSWNKRYIINSENLSGNLLNVEQTTDVGYVSCGWIFNPDQPDNKDYFILKTNSNGIPEWSGFSNQPEADDEFMDIEQTFDGGYIAVGYTNIYPYPTPAVVKLDQNGNLDWGNTYYDDYNLDCVAHSIDLIDDNGDGIEEGYVITGYYGNVNTPTYKRDVWVMRIDLSGTIVWTKDVPMYDDQVGRSIKQYAPGYYAVTGFTELADSMGSTITNLFFMYFNEYSPAVAFYSIGTEGFEDGYAIEKYNDTSFIIAGETSDLYGQNKDALLLNVGLSGTVKWSHIFGDKDPAHPDWARSVEVLDDASQIAFIGTTTRFIDPSGDRDYYVVNTDNNGFAWCDDDSIDLTTVFIWTEFQILEYEFEEIEFEGITVVEYDPPYEEELCPDDDGDAQKRINEDVLFEQSLDGKLKVYPVPLGRDRQLKFDYTSVEDVKIKARVFNLLGSIILEESFEANKGFNTYRLDLNGQSAGTYFLKVSCGGKDYTTKILIME